MRNKNLIIWVVLILILALIVFFVFNDSQNYDEFAKCLSDNGVKMFGAYWCPHCANQKTLFGDSFQYVNYIECSLPERAGQTQICINEDIQTYPTWEFSDGSRLIGVQPLEELNRLSGCALGVE